MILGLGTISLSSSSIVSSPIDAELKISVNSVLLQTLMSFVITVEKKYVPKTVFCDLIE